eukprot:gnl/MRDRNA2_/MRDRNA2_73044_c0_seq2.p1 gnl/MRDRNA2_/MRDRNA2_73044_c0~~gnl/MRDRNA2_/MRDRNA2_73044_c0_seq2.p1  ORF type:complete len:359 (+),score=41.10 gnl/MRDRNA2_/MRDRNA2_73044_c0_seq2:100-1176(+)
MVRILHLSDTHAMHWDIEHLCLPVGSPLPKPLPPADIFVLTGDFTNHGNDDEIESFCKWLQQIADRYHHMLVIPGNHDWWKTILLVKRGKLSAQDVVSPGWYRRKMQSFGLPANCRVLDHEEVNIDGLRIWGSPWCPWHAGGSPDSVGKRFAPAEQHIAEAACKGHRFDEIPNGIDVLLTHGPARMVMDCTGHPGGCWGSSKALAQAIYRAQPRAHLFGHLHEQRGIWTRGPQGYVGEIEYRKRPDSNPFPTNGPPGTDYPCEIISCNAMMNHPGIEQKKPRIAGPPRMIEIQGAMPTKGGHKIGGPNYEYDWPGTQEALRKSMQESALSNKRKREDLEDQQHLEELQLALAISSSCT